MRSEDFLELYREFGDLLENRYSGKKRRYSSVIYEYLNDNESIPVRDKINICREIRNLLTHTANLGGVAVVEPSEPVCDALAEVVEYVKRPPLAIDFATKGDSIFKAGLNQSVIKVMTIMEKNGYSHVPIMENGEFIGVFSRATMFSYLTENYSRPITRNTTLKELRALLPINAHADNYAFADKTLSLYDARDIFEVVRGKNNRVSVIFITRNGNEDEPLLAMITPWDVMGEGN